MMLALVYYGEKVYENGISLSNLIIKFNIEMSTTFMLITLYLISNIFISFLMILFSVWYHRFEPSHVFPKSPVFDPSNIFPRSPGFVPQSHPSQISRVHHKSHLSQISRVRPQSHFSQISYFHSFILSLPKQLDRFASLGNITLKNVLRIQNRDIFHFWIRYFYAFCVIERPPWLHY